MDILPEYVGQWSDDVAAKVSELFGKAEKIPEGTITTADWDITRIRVWYDPATDKVTRVTKG